MAAECQLIQDVEAWFGYQKARNKTTHIYDETIAEDVYRVVLKFIGDAKAFLKSLEEKND